MSDLTGEDLTKYFSKRKIDRFGYIKNNYLEVKRPTQMANVSCVC